MYANVALYFFFSSRRRHTRYWRDWSSDVCSSDLVLVVGVAQEGQDRAVRPGRGLDHVRDVLHALVGVLEEELLAGDLRVGLQVEVPAVGDALELLPADREEVLDVRGAAGVVRELVGLVGAQAQVVRPDPEAGVPVEARLAPVLVPARRLLWGHEVLHLHLLELARAEDEVARRDLVAERLAHLRDAERRAPARAAGDLFFGQAHPHHGVRRPRAVGAPPRPPAPRGVEENISGWSVGQHTS